MKAWRSRLVLVAVIVLLPLEITFIIALWPQLGMIGLVFRDLIIVCCVCVAILAVNFTWRKVREPSVIVERDVVVMLTRTGYVHLSAEQEAAKLLPAPRVQVTEDSLETPPDELQILTLASKGMALRDVAMACNTTYYHVQRVTSAWKKKLEAS